MRTHQVSFEIEVPDDIPSNELETFLRFELGEIASMKLENETLRTSDIESFTVRNVWVS
jgi:hypothetical protein